MTTGETLTDIMEEDGVEFLPNEKPKVARDIQRAIEAGRMRFITRNGHSIGFLTFVPRMGRVLINYCFVYNRFKSRENFMHLRGFFRSFGGQIYWKSKRRKKMCYVK